MSGIRHSVVEAAEPYNPLNDGLDAFSNFVRMLKEYGCEAQMRARFDALIPARAVEPESIADEPIDVLETRMLIDTLKRMEKWKMSDRDHNDRRRALDDAEGRLARAIQALRVRA